jgi:hypothetical protein
VPENSKRSLFVDNFKKIVNNSEIVITLYFVVL